MCLFPRLIKNPKYKPNKKNKGVVPPCVDYRHKWVPVSCGVCEECLKRRANDWKVRLLNEAKSSEGGLYITLTFSEESLEALEGDSEEAKATRAVRLLMERIRKKHKRSKKHWFVTELGQTSTERIHIHGLIWGIEAEDLRKLWKYGWCKLIPVINEAVIGYIVKYIFKKDEKHPDFKAKVYASPGIGAKWIGTITAKRSKYRREKTQDNYELRNGTKIAMPMYYRQKLYTEKQRENLWSMKLNKGVRYVGGVRFRSDDIKGITDYLEFKQKQSQAWKNISAQKDYGRIARELNRPELRDEIEKWYVLPF